MIELQGAAMRHELKALRKEVRALRILMESQVTLAENEAMELTRLQGRWEECSKQFDESMKQLEKLEETF